MDTTPIISKRTVIFSILGVLLLVFLVVSLFHGVLVIKAPDVQSDAKVTITNDQGSKDFVLKRGQSKRLIVSTKKYFIQISLNDTTTTKSVNVNRFYIPKTVQLRLKPQIKTENLGDTLLGCAADASSSINSIYFECIDQVSTPPEIYNGITASRVDFGSVSNLLFSNAPYKNSLVTIQGEADEKMVTFYQTDLSTYKTQLQSRASLPDTFKKGSFKLQTDLLSKDNSLLSLYDVPAEKFLLIDPANGNISKTIALPAKKKVPQYFVTYRFAGKRLYVVRALAPDYDQSNEQGNVFTDFSDPQTFSIIDSASGNTDKTTKLPNDFRVSELYVNSAGRVLLLGFYKKTVGAYGLYEIDGTRLTKLDIQGNISPGLAWLDDNNFYYVNDNKVYKHTMDDQTSYLAYSAPGVSISRLYNAFGSVYMPIFEKGIESITQLKFTSEPLTGDRTEPVLPFYNDIYHSILSIKAYKDTLYIKPLNNDGKTKATILNYLKSLGIDPQNYKVQFQ